MMFALDDRYNCLDRLGFTLGFGALMFILSPFQVFNDCFNHRSLCASITEIRVSQLQKSCLRVSRSQKLVFANHRNTRSSSTGSCNLGQSMMLIYNSNMLMRSSRKVQSMSYICAWPHFWNKLKTSKSSSNNVIYYFSNRRGRVDWIQILRIQTCIHWRFASNFASHWFFPQFDKRGTDGKIQYVSDNRHRGKMLDAVDNWCDESYDRVKLGTLYFPIEFYIDRNTKWIWVKLIDYFTIS
jgi:hypothetical protein